MRFGKVIFFHVRWSHACIRRYCVTKVNTGGEQLYIFPLSVSHPIGYLPNNKWLQKLAYLSGEGWGGEEIRAWVNGRCFTIELQVRLPKREDWQYK
jgi:hypothetical protein